MRCIGDQMLNSTPVDLTDEEIGLLLNWMYRAGASGTAASKLLTKLHAARKTLKDQNSEQPPVVEE
tara:strand:- start:449 stop:646 length:198 start_codon:yes stop_codon:yes gene_type:complete